MCSINCPFNEIKEKNYIENISRRVFNREIEIYKKDIYSSLKYYIKYDPDLTAFRNLSIDHYNKIIDKETGSQVKKATNLINNIVDDKINQIKQKPPVDIIIDSTMKQIKPEIDQNEKYAKAGLVLGIVNFVGLVYLITK